MTRTTAKISTFVIAVIIVLSNVESIYFPGISPEKSSNLLLGKILLSALLITASLVLALRDTVNRCMADLTKENIEKPQTGLISKRWIVRLLALTLPVIMILFMFLMVILNPIPNRMYSPPTDIDYWFCEFMAYLNVPAGKYILWGGAILSLFTGLLLRFWQRVSLGKSILAATYSILLLLIFFVVTEAIILLGGASSICLAD